MGDNMAQMRADLQAYREVGVEHVILALNTGDVQRIRELMDEIAQQIVPHFR